MKLYGRTAWLAISLPITLMVLGAVPSLAQATPDTLAYGRHLSQECTTCHRRDAVDTGIPVIFGLDPTYFRQTMEFYRSGARDNPVMVSVAQTLNEEQLGALAAYLATQKPTAKPTSAKKK